MGIFSGSAHFVEIYEDIQLEFILFYVCILYFRNNKFTRKKKYYGPLGD